MPPTETVNTGYLLVACNCCRDHDDTRLLLDAPVRCVTCGELCSCEGCHAEQEESTLMTELGEHRVGEPAPKIGRFAEIIGPPDCPIMKRWTLIPWRENKHENKDVRLKLMVHHFLPNADDRDVHDHPRPFWTFVLWGRYDDMRPCVCTEDTEEIQRRYWCPACGDRKVVLNERMRPGMLRLRPATHRHRTKVGPKGCWTIVLMGPVRRRWGFWRNGFWWYWKDYERTFGFGMRCDRD